MFQIIYFIKVIFRQNCYLQIFLHIFNDTPKYDDAISFCGVTQIFLLQKRKVLRLYHLPFNQKFVVNSRQYEPRRPL